MYKFINYVLPVILSPWTWGKLTTVAWPISHSVQVGNLDLSAGHYGKKFPLERTSIVGLSLIFPCMAHRVHSSWDDYNGLRGVNRGQAHGWQGSGLSTKVQCTLDISRYIDRLMQERHNTSALAMEIHLFALTYRCCLHWELQKGIP